MFDAAVASEGLGRAEQAMAGAQGGSPDGLGMNGMGAYVAPHPEDPGYPYPDPTESSPHPPPVHGGYPNGGMHGQIDFIEPEDTSGGSATRSAGFTFLFVAVCTGVGYAIRGGLGAATGLLLGAGLANGYRAQKWIDSADPSEKHEAVVSSVLAVGEVGTGLYVGYKAFQLGEPGFKL